MRTAIYFGLLYIGDAIRSIATNPPEIGNNTAIFIGLLFILFIGMDIFELAKKLTK